MRAKVVECKNDKGLRRQMRNHIVHKLALRRKVPRVRLTGCHLDLSQPPEPVPGRKNRSTEPSHILIAINPSFGN